VRYFGGLAESYVELEGVFREGPVLAVQYSTVLIVEGAAA